MYATSDELLDALFSVWSVPRLYNKDQDATQSCETVKYGHESCGTLNQEWLCWWEPAAIYITQPSGVMRQSNTVWVLWALEPRMTVVAKTSSNSPGGQMDRPTDGQTGLRTAAQLPESRENGIRSWVLQDSEPRMTMPVRASSNLPNRLTDCPVWSLPEVAQLPQLWDSKIWPRVPRTFGPKMTVLAKSSSNLPDHLSGLVN
jgi:hypothetical protein